MMIPGAALFALLSMTWMPQASGGTAGGRLAPPFPSEDQDSWIGPPQSLAALRGKVVLLDVWTFG